MHAVHTDERDSGEAALDVAGADEAAVVELAAGVAPGEDREEIGDRRHAGLAERLWGEQRSREAARRVGQAVAELGGDGARDRAGDLHPSHRWAGGRRGRNAAAALAAARLFGRITAASVQGVAGVGGGGNDDGRAGVGGGANVAPSRLRRGRQRRVRVLHDRIRRAHQMADRRRHRVGGRLRHLRRRICLRREERH